MTGQLLTPAQAEAVSGIGRRTLARWADVGTLPRQQRTLGGHRRYRPADLRQAAKLTRPGRS